MMINQLIISDSFDIDKEVELEIENEYTGGRETTYLTEEDAMQLMEHLVKVFKFSDYEIGGLQSNE